MCDVSTVKSGWLSHFPSLRDSQCTLNDPFTRNNCLDEYRDNSIHRVRYSEIAVVVLSHCVFHNIEYQVKLRRGSGSVTDGQGHLGDDQITRDTTQFERGGHPQNVGLANEPVNDRKKLSDPRDPCTTWMRFSSPR